MKEKEAKLSIELIEANGPNGEDLECKCHIKGRTGSLLQAFEQLSLHLLETLRDRYGKQVAMAAYAHCQSEALKGIGIDIEKEAEEAAGDVLEKLKQKKRKDALMSILGKTFQMPEKEDK